MLRMTRAELHGLGWSKPMTEIARLMASGTSMSRKPVTHMTSLGRVPAR
ncbi:hypothetical protein [Mesorhizobium sp.]|nr:hypothetical protein [Mesorhizobium sp.]